MSILEHMERSLADFRVALEIGQREHDEDQQRNARDVAEDLDVEGQHETKRPQRQQPDGRAQAPFPQ